MQIKKRNKAGIKSKSNKRKTKYAKEITKNALQHTAGLAAGATRKHQNEPVRMHH